MRNFVVVGVLLTLCVGAVQAGPTYSFVNITNNNSTNAAIGEAQLFVEITEPAPGSVGFYFTNIGPEACAITDVYFDDGVLASLTGITTTSSGVSFSQGASPGNLPGGNALIPPFDAIFSADSNPPTAPNGVDPGEDLTIVFSLAGGKDYEDVLDAMDSGDLRIGIHVQAFANGGSESFVNNGPTIPAPGAILLASLGVGLVGWLRQRRSL